MSDIKTKIQENFEKTFQSIKYFFSISLKQLFTDILFFLRRPDKKEKNDGFKLTDKSTIGRDQYHLLVRSSDQSDDYKIMKKNTFGGYDTVDDKTYKKQKNDDSGFLEDLKSDRFKRICEYDHMCNNLIGMQDKDGYTYINVKHDDSSSDVYKTKDKMVVAHLGHVDKGKRRNLQNHIRDLDARACVVQSLLDHKILNKNETSHLFPQWYTNANNKVWRNKHDKVMDDVIKRMGKAYDENERLELLGRVLSVIDKGDIPIGVDQKKLDDVREKVKTYSDGLKNHVSENQKVIDNSWVGYFLEFWCQANRDAIDDSKRRLEAIGPIGDRLKNIRPPQSNSAENEKYTINGNIIRKIDQR